MCAAAHGWAGLGRIVFATSTEQLGQWRAELGLPPSPVAALRITEVVPGAEGYVGLFAALHAALASDGPLPVTLDDGRRSIELASAIYHSAATGGDVLLPLGRDHPTYRGWSCRLTAPAGAGSS